MTLALSAPQVPPSFKEVYQAHARLVWRVLRRLGVPPADLEDVCQEVFVVVHRKLSQFSARSSVRTWVYGIAARSASEYRRRGHVKRESADGEPAQQVAEPAQLMTIERREARAHLDAIIDQLDEAKRAVFVLFELEELPMAEVADALSCPLQTAYSRLHAARREVEAAVKRLELKERMR